MGRCAYNWSAMGAEAWELHVLSQHWTITQQQTNHLASKRLAHCKIILIKVSFLSAKSASWFPFSFIFISSYKLLMSIRENQVTIFSLIPINTFRQGEQEVEVTVHERVGNFLKVLPFCTDKAVWSVFTMKELGSGKLAYCLRSLCTVVLSELWRHLKHTNGEAI